MLSMKHSHPKLWTRRPWICNACRANYSISPLLSQFSFSTTRRAAHQTKRNQLPNKKARTRFAPSPTGFLHLGSLRTALFNYLLARRTGGQFLLRLEDTDQKRTIEGAEKRLCEDLQWAGLLWDEGPGVGGPFGPYRQSERTALYRSYAERLLPSGHAYRCFCTPERLDALARQRNELGLPLGYDRTCADIPLAESEDRVAKGEHHVIRLRAPDEYPIFTDLVYGVRGKKNASRKSQYLQQGSAVYEDPILLKTDGHPTYHLANVVDDYLMKISHVIRGTEWLTSTPTHLALYKAFNWDPPEFAHVPLLVDKNGQKLSKRNSDIDISDFRDVKGIFPETLVNFAALLGWSHTQRSDVMSLKDLEKAFSLKFTEGNTIVSFEKLWFLQKAHAQRYASTDSPEFERMVKQVSHIAAKTYRPEQLHPMLQGRSLDQYIYALLRADSKCFTNANDFLQRNNAFFTQVHHRSLYERTSQNSIPLSALHTATAVFCLVPEDQWTSDTHRANISAHIGLGRSSTSAQQQHTQSAVETPRDMTQLAKRWRKELFHYLRWALTGGAPGPGIPETMAVFGKEICVQRIQEARRASLSVDSGIHGRENGDEKPKIAVSLAAASS